MYIILICAIVAKIKYIIVKEKTVWWNSLIYWPIRDWTKLSQLCKLSIDPSEIELNYPNSENSTFLLFFLDRIKNTEDWMWYEKHIVTYLLHNLQLSDRFTSAQIQRCIGLINVNAVALKFPMLKSSTTRKNFQRFVIIHSA